MKYADFVVGMKVVIVREGLINTGEVGEIVKIGKTIAFVKVPDGNIRNYKPDSLEIYVEPVAVEPVAPVVPVVPAKVAPTAGSVIFYQKEIREDILQQCFHIMKEGEVFGVDKKTSTATIDGKPLGCYGGYQGFIEVGDEVTPTKPEDDMEWPGWIGDEMLGKKKFVEVYEDQGMSGAMLSDEYIYSFDWLLKGTKLRGTDGLNRPQPAVYEKGIIPDVIMAEMKEHAANEARGLSFAVYTTTARNAKGYRVHMNNGAACNWGLRIDVPQGTECFAVVQWITDKYYKNSTAYTDEMIDTYLTWVITESPWARYILNDSLEHAKEFGVMFNPDIADNALITAMIVMRYPTEYPQTITNWYKLVTEMGCNKNAALFLADTNMGSENVGRHHSFTDTKYWNTDALINFIKGGEGLGANDEIYSQSWNYSNVSYYCGGSIYPNGNNALNQLKKKFKAKVIERKHAILGTQKVELPAIEQMVEWCNEQVGG